MALPLLQTSPLAALASKCIAWRPLIGRSVKLGVLVLPRPAAAIAVAFLAFTSVRSLAAALPLIFGCFAALSSSAFLLFDGSVKL